MKFKIKNFKNVIFHVKSWMDTDKLKYWKNKEKKRRERRKEGF